MARQLTFEMPVREASGREDFFLSASNRAAVATLEAAQGWPRGKLVLAGPPGSGKTHLARIWSAEAGAALLPAANLARTELPELAATGAVCVEDADRIAGDRPAEVALFHLHNLLAETGGRLLLTARRPPVRWQLGLPDLASRMQAAGLATLEAPDDALLSAVLVKLFADRQLAVAPQVVSYLAARMDRSFAAARSLVARIDARALTEGRTVTRQFAGEVLAAEQENPRHATGDGLDTPPAADA